ncbi:hypothetical protein ACLWNE_05105 [Thermus oshimai]|uniref:hypothetical protein n=1 Tax=Thermus oshimai TaxID=56957 RepID=UPI0031FB0DC9
MPDPEVMAEILVYAAVAGDRAACERYRVSARTLRRWRARLAHDPVLATYVRQKKEVAASLRPRLEEVLLRLVEDLKGPILRMLEMDPSPQAIHAAFGGVKILGDLFVSLRFLEDRNAPTPAPDPQQGEVWDFLYRATAPRKN